MALRIILVILIIILGVLVVIPFVLSIAGVRSFQFGSLGEAVPAGEGILRSEDLGKTWESAAVSEEKRVRFPAEIFDIAFHPEDPKVIYLGTKSAGLWRSENAGKSWKKMADRALTLDPAADVYKIAVNRVNPKIIYLAVFQDQRGRVLKSENGGESFNEVYFVAADRLLVTDLYINPRNADQVIITAGQGGLFETLNGGVTWRVKRWFSEALTQLVVNPAFIREMYVTTASGNLFKTFDGGENWADLNAGFKRIASAQPRTPQLNLNPFGEILRRDLKVLVMDPNVSVNLYLGSRDALLKSTDGGFSWQRLEVLIPPEALPVGYVAIDPRNSARIFVAAANQLHFSGDGGVNWDVDVLPTESRIKKLLIHPGKPEVMFAILGR